MSKDNFRKPGAILVAPNGRQRRRWVGLAFAALPLAAYLAIVIAPLIRSINYSFYKWNGVSEAEWVGLRNYVNFFRDPILSSTLGHVLVFVLFFSVLPTALGLITAGMLTRYKQPGMSLFRWIFFLPQVLTSVVVALVFKRIYSDDGLVNTILRAIGLDSIARPWLGDFTWALPALGLIGTWVTFGFCMVLFITGASQIPVELYEAARMDGASAVQEFLHVTIPGLRPQIGVVLIITVTAALRTFDLVWVTTRGGPGTSTMTPAVALYKAAFVSPNVGQAAAIGVIMAVACLAIALVIQKLSEDV